jgi:ribosome biogenesis protein BRX1
MHTYMRTYILVQHDSKDELQSINEIAEMKGCDTTIFFECRKKKDLYLWFNCTPNGPSAKFHVQNVHTMDELKLTGNCLLGSRPLLLFDSKFDEIPHLQLLKQIFIKTWNTPRNHPKSKPFVDHIFSFYYADNRVWFRNYQIADTSKDIKELKKMAKAGEETTSLIEIGPRFVLNLIRIFSGSFTGSTLYANPHYVSPNATRSDIKKEKANRYAGRLAQQAKRAKVDSTRVIPKDKLADVFISEGGNDDDDDDDDDE